MLGTPTFVWKKIGKNFTVMPAASALIMLLIWKSQSCGEAWGRQG